MMKSSYRRKRFGDRVVGTFIGFACLLGLVPAGPADAQLMVVGIDRKFAAADGKRQALAPGHDSLLVFDLKNPAKPALIGDVALENSIVGPPTNLAITPDQRLALVANAVHSERAADGAGWVSVPAEEGFVVDLTARPITVIGTVKVGAQPSGLAIDRTGEIASVETTCRCPGRRHRCVSSGSEAAIQSRPGSGLRRGE